MKQGEASIEIRKRADCGNFELCAVDARGADLACLAVLPCRPGEIQDFEKALPAQDALVAELDLLQKLSDYRSTPLGERTMEQREAVLDAMIEKQFGVYGKPEDPKTVWVRLKSWMGSFING